MGIIVINDGYKEHHDPNMVELDSLDEIRILFCPQDTTLEADVIVQVRDWLFKTYDACVFDENKHWRDRRALANAVVEHAATSKKQFWAHFRSKHDESISLGEFVRKLPKFTYQTSEDDILSSMSPP